MKNKLNNNIIITGGGTGGHIYPAIAIADAIKKINPNINILFVGALGKMEMEKVPKEGYEIIGLDIAGFQRKFTLKNLLLPYKIFKSIKQARNILRQYKPILAIGVGGYASGPLLKTANLMNIKTMIQEQNSFPGITNKLLSKKAKLICVAFDGMETFFPKEKIVVTGNPIRSKINVLNKDINNYDFFKFDKNKKTLLIIGGSLGAKSINEAVLNNIDKLSNIDNIQIIWQCGKIYLENIKIKLDTTKYKNLYLSDFIYEMDIAYNIADLVISRAGAISISELSIANKSIILVPSPNVSEDHQTKNAMRLVNENAAIYIKDSEINERIYDNVKNLINNDEQLLQLSKNIQKFAKPNASFDIANLALNLCKTNNSI